MPSDPHDGDEEAALRARLDRLAGDLKKTVPPRRSDAPASPTAASATPDSVGSAMSLGLRAGSEFVTAVFLGAAIGWGIDKLIGTKPAFLIVFFLVGVVAGVWNVIRVTSPKGASLGHNSRLPPQDAPDKDVRRPAAGPHDTRPSGSDDGD